VKTPSNKVIRATSIIWHQNMYQISYDRRMSSEHVTNLVSLSRIIRKRNKLATSVIYHQNM